MNRSALITRLGTAAAVGALVVAVPTAAFADVSNAQATAASVSLLGAAAVTSGTVSATNNGSQATQTSATTPALSVLGGQGVLTAGVLAQNATAFADGSSAACSGIVGTGGTIAVGGAGACTVSAGVGGGVRIAVAGLTEIRADAIVASCTATSAGATTAAVRLIGAGVYVAGLKTSVIPDNPAANTGLSIGGLAGLLLNAQTAPAGAGSLRTVGLGISLLGTTTTVALASATCGLNVHTLPTPALPKEGWPLAAGLLALAGWAMFRRFRDLFPAGVLR